MMTVRFIRAEATILALAGLIYVPSAQAADKNAPKVVSSLTSIHMVNQTIGWALGKGTVWHTTDEAMSWQNVSPTGLNWTSGTQLQLSLVNDKYAWVAVTSYNNRSTVVYRTSNGGRSWNETKINDTGDILSFEFSDQNDGWLSLMQGAAAGSEAESIYRTVNGGVSWDEISSTHMNATGNQLPFGGDKTGTSFIDTMHGWATGFSPISGRVYLYHTINGGHTWKTQNVSVPSQVQTEQFISYPPVFFDSHDGVLPIISWAVPTELLVYRTHNGGDTWIPTAPLASVRRGTTFQARCFITQNSWFVTDGEKLYFTVNRGQTWKSIKPNVSFKSVAELDFTSPVNGWALMTSGTLYHTVDGGYQWRLCM